MTLAYYTVFVGVNYKTPNESVCWINSIVKNEKESLVILVDNSQMDNPTLHERINALGHSNVIYLNVGENVGYLNGVNYAKKYLEENQIDYTWLVASNVDITLASENVNTELKKDEEYGIVAPAIVSDLLGCDKNPYRVRRSPLLDLLIKRFFFSNRVLNLFYSMLSELRNRFIHSINDKQEKSREEIYLPYGACMIINRAFFKKGGTIEYPLFIFGEELFLAEQIIQLKMKILYNPSIRFTNFEHASTSRLTNDFVRECNYKSMDYIIRTFY